MRIIAIIFGVLSSIIWFLGSIGSLNSYLKNVTPPPQPPTVGGVIGMAFLAVLSIITLVYLFKSPGEATAVPAKKMPAKKFFIGFAWFAIILVGSQFIAGMIIGAIAGSSSGTAAGGAEAGAAASVAFFKKFGIIFWLGALVAAIVGTWKE